jgi:hypothetical protein
MRVVALGWCAVLTVGVSHSACAADLQGSVLPPPIAVNDHDGGFIPRPGTDRGFTINPDGPMAASASGNADQDEDGSDIAIYQGEDDQLPS